ncbi:protease (plasmid) [Pacificitalea manganoxidans]|uniref:Protease n=1 Tax=Pacificitalea manganoxidans TaxID=1411902 RepID=A0A291M3Q8_9RHOB|nr:type 1 glutamine amidotransferase domain-containing protein [Pacificitalea manganoxidans]ATI43569.1 protease [Pacificitalea manganoxidans]MDR6309994.1 protease I [Pacificitalea manganoxidans]
MTAITDAKILILATDGFEQSELKVPHQKLKDAGAEVHIVSPEGDAIKGWDEKNWGETIPADRKLSDVSADDYHALVLPGGQINPDILRTIPEAVSLVKAFHDSGKIIAAICHGPWLLVEADVVRGRDVTSYPSIQTDLKNAGGNWQDAEVVTDRGIITSRKPDDLDAFVSKIIEEVREGRHERDAA